MHFSLPAASAALLAFASTVTAYVPASTAQTDALAALGLAKLVASLAANATHPATGPKTATQSCVPGSSSSAPSPPSSSTCTLLNAAKRQEWSSLSPQQRVEYTDSIKCLMSKPSIADPSFAPGARSRYDDFVSVHINQTLTIHGTANFLYWHRYFTWALENALRTECGYTGWQPYWNWGKSAFDPAGSPYFDGGPYSLSGNGIFEAHNQTVALPNGLNPIPPGSGGGCVENGPFKNMTVNLGPVAPTLAEPEDVSTGSGLTYNPRCLKRDITDFTSKGWLKDSDSYNLITTNGSNIYWFQTIMQGNYFIDGFYGVHTAGHFTFGNGDPGGDLFASPGDPAFFNHHGQIDRTFWIWQNQDLANRQNAISATITLNNSPPSRNGTLDDIVDLGVNAPALPIRDLTNTLAGPFCYIYV